MTGAFVSLVIIITGGLDDSNTLETDNVESSSNVITAERVYSEYVIRVVKISHPSVEVVSNWIPSTAGVNDQSTSVTSARKSPS